MKKITNPRRKICTCLISLITLGLGQSLSAGMLSVASDTYLTEHPGHGGTSLVQGSSPNLSSIGAPSYLTYPLIRFDLSSLAGQTITGTPQIEVFLTGGHSGSEGVARTVSLHPVLVSWNDQTVSWDSFGASPGVNFETDVGASVSARTVDWAGGVPGFYAWDVPAGVLQSWIDQPAQNFGLLLNNQATAVQVDLGFAALESDLYPEARLVFAVVPEPSHSAVLIGSGILAWGLFRSRKRRKHNCQR